MADGVPNDQDLARFVRAVEQLDSVLTRTGSNSGNQSTITLNAGGAAVWVAVSACAVMLAMNCALMVLLVNHDRKIDDMEHYINAIYQAAPQLRQEERAN
jgi:hypothetical protein